jgi:hypothetical protein
MFGDIDDDRRAQRSPIVVEGAIQYSSTLLGTSGDGHYLKYIGRESTVALADIKTSPVLTELFRACSPS